MIGKTVSHYRVLEKLGEGGMGVVFKAEDLKLDRFVALKFLSEASTLEHRALARFEREAKTASALNHPNICTIHEISEFEGQPFIVMELLEGRPLSDLMQERRLELRELLDLGLQITGALAAAHEKGILHRDIKPANVFVTTRSIAKLLDFGLAKLTIEPRAIATATSDSNDRAITTEQALTGLGIPMGTVAYMSPEQARGEALDVRSDIFSFGVMLYEMATGSLPFRGTSTAALLGAILYETPRPPSELNPALPRELERLVARTLKKDRELRYQSAAELHTHLVDVRDEIEPGKTGPKRTVIWTAVLTIVALVLLAIGISATSWFRVRHGPLRTPAVQSQIKPRRSVAVLGFKNLTTKEDVSWLSTALSEMLSTELSTGGALRIVPGENVTRTKMDLSLSDADSFGKETLARIKKALGTDFLVVGSYTDLGAGSGGQIRLDVRLQDTEQGETIAAVSETGTEANLFQLVSYAGSQLRQNLGTKEISPGAPGSRLVESQEGVRASLPSNPKVARLYAEGLNDLRSFEALNAQRLLEQVVVAERDYAPGHSALSQAYSALGFDQKATSEAKQAFELSGNLSREDRLFIEARYREAAREWARAIEVYRTLWSSFPDNLEYGLRLAGVQTQAGKGSEALATIETLRRLPGPSRDDPRIDLAQSSAADSLGEYERALQSARNAASKSQDSRLLLARAYTSEAWALERLGKPREAASALHQAKDLYTAAGQKQGTGRVLLVTGRLAFEAGDLIKARQSFQQALAIFQQIGDRSGTANTLTDIGNLLYTEGDFSGAKSVYEQSLAVLREVGSKSGVAGALGNIANVLDSQGDLAAARKMQEQALAAFREVGDQRGASSTLSNLGNLLLEQGELQSAKQAQEEALAQREKIGYKNGVGFGLHSLGAVLAAEGDLTGAREKYEQALALRRELGQRGNAAATSVELAALLIEDGKPANAEAAAAQAIEEFLKEKQPEDEAGAQAILARALLANNKLAQARSAIVRARAIMPPSAAYPTRFEVSIAAARVQAASGQSREAKQALENVVNVARQHGYRAFEFQARLALGEIELQSETAVGRARLEQLQTDAELKSFHLIARRAEEALGRAAR